ncbi:MAG: PA14 domain-containing protein [Alphaproteobacteria bacterium]
MFRAYAVRLASVAAAACVAASLAMAAPVPGVKPAQPQPAADKLQPGLSVNYTYMMFSHVSEVPKGGKGKPGPVLANLDHRTDSGNVLTATNSMGVGAQINGFIKLDKPGTYTFELLSNDGVKWTVGGVLMHEDPGIHGDTTSPPVEVAVTEPGWYAFSMDYFQRKGTSALRLSWKPPGGQTMVVVPPEAFASLKP